MQKIKFARTAMIVGMLTTTLSLALYLGGGAVNQEAFADKESKTAHYASESGASGQSGCLKDPSDPTALSCKEAKEFNDANINKSTREGCEERSLGEKCKQVK